MPKFQYTAVNSAGSTLHGVVEATDIRSAKVELNKLDLQVVDLAQVDLKTKLLTSSLNKFKFEAVNQEGKVIKGTISALDEGKALLRLKSEYMLTVNKISDINVNDKAFKEKDVRTSNSNDVKFADKARIKALRDLLIPLIDDLKALMKYVTDDLLDQVGPPTKEFLAKYYLHLDKIKFSENLNNIQSVCLKVCSVLENSDIFLENNDKVKEKLRVNLMARDLDKKFRNYDLAPSKRKGLSTESKVDSVWNLVSIIFSSKSSSQRKFAVSDLMRKLKSIFKFEDSKLTKFIKALREVSLWFLLVYGVYFAFSHFVSVKSPKFSLPGIFEIYSTSVMIYLVVGALLLNLCLELCERIVKNRLLKIIVGCIFLALYLMICINL